MVRVWGPRAIEVADAVFRPDRGVRLAETRRGRFADRPDRPRTGRRGGRRRARRRSRRPSRSSATAGTRPFRLVVEALQTAGATSADALACGPGHPADPFADDCARLTSCQAPTLTTAEILLDQAQGALRGELVRLGDWIADEPDRALAELETLIGRGQIGLRLIADGGSRSPAAPTWGRAVCSTHSSGSPGRSSTRRPGTTRDVVSRQGVFGGWPVELADTAGLRADALTRSRRSGSNDPGANTNRPT